MTAWPPDPARGRPAGELGRAQRLDLLAAVRHAKAYGQVMDAEMLERPPPGSNCEGVCIYAGQISRDLPGYQPPEVF